ncbi:hypothetical protein M6B38_335360 [Iris pallida]|uniref:Uncharacterized protein n=1 Tax=Iris pallida TaxID=29817 RepID=A0AAX6H134_IRIPA|nr:hypothetical protein M6B38_335360 [Iris pallida]
MIGHDGLELDPTVESSGSRSEVGCRSGATRTRPDLVEQEVTNFELRQGVVAGLGVATLVYGVAAEHDVLWQHSSNRARF